MRRTATLWIALLAIATSVAAQDMSRRSLPSDGGRAKADYATARLQRRLAPVRIDSPIRIDGALDEQVWAGAPVARDFIQSEPREGQPASERTEVRVLYDKDHLYFGVVAFDSQPDRIIVNELKKDFATESSDAFGIILDTYHDERNGFMFGTNPMGAKWDAQSVNEGREVNTSWDGVWHVATRIVDDGWYAEIAIPFQTLKFTTANPQTWGINFLRRIRRRNEDTFWAPIPRFHRLQRVSLAGTLEGLQGLRPGNNIRVKPYVQTNGVAGVGIATKGDADAGFDVKYGITNSLTWDFTVHTDFSQVEADEQQVNLTRFSLFFPEKRDFFLENSGVFFFGPGERMRGSLTGGIGGRQNAQRNDLILFFSRNIGLSKDAEAIPIVAGTRLTGRIGGFGVGALNIQQQRHDETSPTNFTALRLRRDVLANSDVGVMFLDKEQAGAHDNRVIGTDANFRFFGNLEIATLAAKTFSPAEVVGGRGKDAAGLAMIAWRDDFWDLRATYLGIGEQFNDEMGFVPRTGISKTEIFGGVHWRPRAVSGWLREIFPHWQLVDIHRMSGGLDSRYIDYHLPVTLQDSTFIEVGINPNVEDIQQSFVINRPRDIRIAPGRYTFDEYFVLVNTDRSAPLSFNGRYSNGPFYDGYRRGYTLGAAARVSAQLNLSANLSINDINLPAGDFTTHLLTGRVDYSFSTRMFLNALLQYNTDARQWSSNVRFNIIHRPLSDLFLVYNERRGSDSGDLIDRAVIAKMTYMVAF